MESLNRSLRALRTRLFKAGAQFTAGGSWTDLLESQVRKNLRWFWLDGLFSSASDAVYTTYQSLFILALGATNAQLGLLSSLSSLSAVIVLMPAALLSERLGRRKEIALISGGVIGRLILLALIFVPILLAGPSAIYLAIGLTILRDALNYFGLPAWISLSGDLVPLSWRGRYFGSRNFIIGIAGMVMTLAFGEIITRSGTLQGYQVAYGMAFLIGGISTYVFSRIREPAAITPIQAPESFTWKSALGMFRGNRLFFVFCVVSFLWNFSLNISGPFFLPFQVKVLEASATMVGILTIVSQVSSLIGQRPFGALADRWGPRRIVIITGFIIPLIPLAWVFINDVRQAIGINILSGAMWAGYSLASFNYLLEISPAEQRARFSALYQIVVALSMAAGAAVGSIIVTEWGYRVVFAGSALGRFTAAALFFYLVRPVKVQSVSNGTT